MTTEDIITRLKNIYILDCDVCMAEMLASIKVPEGVTFEQAFEAYIALMKWSDKDEFYTIKEGETIAL